MDHIRIEDLVDGQEELILSAGHRVADLVEQGHVVGIYCQSGVSRTPAVAICYLMLKGASLDDATAIVREARPVGHAGPRAVPVARGHRGRPRR